LHSMDDDVMKNELLPILCGKHKDLLTSIRRKMSEETALCKIFIRSLSYETQDETVYELFSAFGNVQEAVIVKDRVTGHSRGFGFITMSNASEAQAALVQHRKMIDGREAICNLASKPQGQKPGIPSFHHYGHRKRDDSFSSHHRRGPEQRPFARKRCDAPNGQSERYPRGVPPPPSPYSYPAAANPYGYDYGSYQYPSAAVAPYSGMNPYANPYGHYARSAGGATNSNNGNSSQSAPTMNGAAANVAAQPYAAQQYQPAMAGQTANVVANAQQTFTPTTYR